MPEQSHVDIEVPFAYRATLIRKGKRNPTVETIVDFVPFRVPWIREKDVDRTVEYRQARPPAKPAIEETLSVLGDRLLMPVLSWRPGGNGFARSTFADHVHAVMLLKAAGWVGDVDVQFERNPLFDRTGLPNYQAVAAVPENGIREILSHDREARLALALEAAATMVFVEGHLHSSAYEPVAALSSSGSTSWHCTSTIGTLGAMGERLPRDRRVFMAADDPRVERSCEGSWLVGDLTGVRSRFRATELSVRDLLQAWISEIRVHDGVVGTDVPIPEGRNAAILVEIDECRRHANLMSRNDRRYDFDALLEAIVDLRTALDGAGVAFPHSEGTSREALFSYVAGMSDHVPGDPEDGAAMAMGI